MTVYVDNMKAEFRGMIMSHMIADTDEELHQMAQSIGLKRSWWQPPTKGGSHYDVSQPKKQLAIKKGAIQITLRQLAAMNFRRKSIGELGDPETAIDWLRGQIRKNP